MFERFARTTREAVAQAVKEAARRGDRRVGTEHLLLGLLHDPAGPAAAVLATDLGSARRAVDALDRAALAAIGVDTTATAATAPSDGPEQRRQRARPRLTAAAADALRRTLRVATARRSARLEPEHLLVALLECSWPDPLPKLFAQLDVDVAAARARLAGAA
jgi:ATP-dependent Clp protease ATP-binding subunit ClpA